MNGEALLVTLHVGTGAVALLAGAAALAFRKGGLAHRTAGNVFFVSMMVMAGIGATVAWFNSVLLSFAGGALTCYLVATAWVTVMRPPGTVGRFEVVAMLFAVWAAALTIAGGVEGITVGGGFKDGFPTTLYFIFGSVLLLAAAFDLRMLRKGGLRGAARLSRHLGRMGGGMFMATAAFFLGQAQLFPEAIRAANVLPLPVFAVIISVFYWLVRVRWTPHRHPWVSTASSSDTRNDEVTT